MARIQKLFIALTFPITFSCLPACSSGKYVPLAGPDVKLPLIIKIKVNDQEKILTLQCEIAAEEESRRVGLMFRKPEDFPADRAMLFIFQDLKKQSFFMRNTTIPLSIAFISEDGEILQIEDMKPYDERSTESKNKVRYALEVNQGWFAKNEVKVGDKFDEFATKLEPLRG